MRTENYEKSLFSRKGPQISGKLETGTWGGGGGGGGAGGPNFT